MFASWLCVSVQSRGEFAVGENWVTVKRVNTSLAAIGANALEWTLSHHVCHAAVASDVLARTLVDSVG